MPPPGQKKFECEHCQDAILVAVDHSSTSSVCQQVTSSPPLRESYSEARGEDLTNIRDHSQPASSKPTDQRKSGGGAGLLWGLAVTPLKKRRSFVIGTDQTLPDMKIFYEGGLIKRDDLRADYFSEWARARTDADRLKAISLSWSQTWRSKIGCSGISWSIRWRGGNSSFDCLLGKTLERS
jgi:hypothetical protein